MIIRYDKRTENITVGYDKKGRPFIRLPAGLPLSAGEQFAKGWERGMNMMPLCGTEEKRLLILADGYAQRWCDRNSISMPHIELNGNCRFWGRCDPSKGIIMLHPDLSRMPDDVQRSVILHELSHLICREHSASFWRMMSAEMPDWHEMEGVLRCLGKKIRAEKRRS